MSSFTVQIEESPVKSLQIETSVGNNPASIEVQTFDNNIVQIESGLTLTPLEVVNLLNARISQFLQAGSGITLSSNADSLTINSYTLPHVHSTNDIVGLVSAIQQNSTVKNILASSGISVTSNSGIYSISLSNPNLQSSNILDFAQSVSGLLPVTNVSSGSGISVTKIGTNYTVAVTGEFGLTPEQVDDRVSGLLVAGSNIVLNYNDSNNTLTISTSGLQPSGNYSLVGHSHVVNDITNLQNILDGKQPSGNYSIFGHNHSINDVTGLQIALDNKQPSGNYSLVGHLHNISDISGLQSSLDSKQPSGNYANFTHSHTSSQITDFNTSVSGLLIPYATINSPSFSGTPTVPTALSGTNNTQIANTQFVRTEISNLVNAAPTTLDTLNELATALGNDPNFATTVTNNLASKANLSGSVFTGPISGPSGNFIDLRKSDIPVSVSGHIHNSSDITDFSASVSGLLPVTNITGNSGIVINKSGTTYNVSSSGLAYLSGANFSGSISAPSGSFSGPIFASSGNFDSNLRVNNVPVSVSGHTHTASAITDFNSAAAASAPVQSVAGRTGAVTLAKGDVGLGNVPNVDATARANHTGTQAISTVSGLQTALDAKAPLVNADMTDLVVYASLSNIGADAIFTCEGTINTYKTVSSRGINVFPAGTGGLVGAPTFNVGSAGIINAGTWQATPVAVAYGGTGATTAAAARTNLGVAYGATSGTVCQGNDSRLSDVRVPTAHQSTHAIGGTDALTPTDIGAANASHTHPSSNITDFNSSVSGLLPVKDISAGTYINVTNNSGIYTVNSTGEANLLETTVFNKTGSSIPKLSVVYINGGQGDQPTIALASASGEMTSSKTYGITAENIDNMSTGKVIVAGALTGVNTDQFNPTAPQGDINGTTLWLSPTVPGGLTRTKPSAPYHMVSVGTVVRTHQNEGVIEVRIQNGFELEELHNVAISGLSNNQFIKYDSSTSLWKNVTAIASDISDFNSSVSGLLPVTNILGGTNISVVPSGSSYTVSVSGQLGLTAEEVDDRVSGLLVAGSGINLNYNDSGNTLTINNTSISPDEVEEYVTFTNLPASGNINILYRTTDDGRLYQWSGSVYAEIGPDSVTTGSHASQHYTNGIDPILNVVSRPATLTATVNNYAHNNADIIYLNADANRIITGLAAAADGSVKLLINSSLFTITLDHQDTNSNPENRFIVPFGSDYILQPGYSITIVYDSNALRWRILA